MSLEDYSVTRMRLILNNEPSYTTYFSVQGVQVVMEVGYNTRNKRRWISLRTVSYDILLQRTFLNGFDRVKVNVNSEILGISFFIVLEPKNLKLISDDYLNWKENYWLTFVSNDIEYDEEVEKLILNNFVGGRG